jgi:hypothetical protein
VEEKLEPKGNNSDLQAENNFLKMKMMLEHGAEFGSSKDLSPALENEFLRSVIEYEKQFEKGERIKVFDKLGQPHHFKPVLQIPESEIENEWIALHEFMQERGIDLSVCSPNVTARELYRFTMEELFQVETDKIDLPGMMTCFIYDEFHPDYVYENSRVAVEECMDYFFNKNTFYDHHFADYVRLNHHQKLSRSELQFVIQKFKNDYDQIMPVSITTGSCVIKNDLCFVKGFYEAALIISGRSSIRKGDWMVGFQLNEENDYWYINDIMVRGIDIP